MTEKRNGAMGPVEPSAIEADLPAEPARAPRLTILHVMIWTAISAVELTLSRLAYMAQSNLGWTSDVDLMQQRIAAPVYSVMAGGVVTGAGILVVARLRRRPLKWQPGHWLLLFHAATLVVIVPAAAIWYTEFERAAAPSATVDSDPIDWFSTAYAAIHLVVGIGYAMVLFRIPTVRWKLVFAGLAASSALLSLWTAALSGEWDFDTDVAWGMDLWASHAWASYASCAWVVVVSVWDIVTRQRRDWLHWLGVVALLVNVVMYIYWQIGLLLFKA